MLLPNSDTLAIITTHANSSLSLLIFFFTTLLGKITFRRSVFRNASGTLTNIPLVEALGVRRMILCQFRWQQNPRLQERVDRL